VRRTTNPSRRLPAAPEAGQAFPLLLLVVALVAALLVGLARLGADQTERAWARTAADAAALAGASEGRSAARQLAGDNHGQLLSYVEAADGTVVVTVRVGTSQATASARSGAG